MSDILINQIHKLRKRENVAEQLAHFVEQLSLIDLFMMPTWRAEAKLAEIRAIAMRLNHRWEQDQCEKK